MDHYPYVVAGSGISIGIVPKYGELCVTEADLSPIEVRTED